MNDKTQYLFEKDWLGFLGQPFSVEFPINAAECISRIEANIEIQTLQKSKKSRLKLSALDNTKYLFSFDGMGDLRSLKYKGIIEQISTHETTISGVTRLANSAILKNTVMIILTLIFIKLPYISLAFFLITVGSVYTDMRLSRNAVAKLKSAIQKT